jgi:hypothetical protein
MKQQTRVRYIFVLEESSIFLKKVDFGTHSDPKIGRRVGRVSYNEARKDEFRNAVPGCVLLTKNVLNGVPARSVTIIPLLRTSVLRS